MSKVEVNTVEPQCGTTLTLGGSGDTVALGSGASQTGFGRTGTVDWQTASIKTTGFTAVSGNGYFCNTSGGAFTATLPASPTAGDIVAVSDYTRTFNTYNLTIGRNSKPIGGVALDSILTVDGQSATFVFVDDTEGWINIQETETSLTGTSFMIATGGTPCSGAIVCTNYKQHTFTGPGTFCVSQISNATDNNAVAYTVVAGGGGGGGGGVCGAQGGGGGGGAGGFREGRSPITPYTASPLVAPTGITVTASAYPITVGGGGCGTNGAPQGGSGSTSTFSTIDSAGGGGGGSAFGYSPYQPSPGSTGDGLNGGSGGGGGISDNVSCGNGGAGDTPNVTPDQGFDGGDANPGSVTPPFGNYEGAGGGGATAVGGNFTGPGTGPPAGHGGAGATSSINATPTARAGGGGGGGPCSQGGTGGGGAGGAGVGVPDNNGIAGTVNTGGGGGGANNKAPAIGGNGGSGVVIIRYKFQ